MLLFCFRQLGTAHQIASSSLSASKLAVESNIVNSRTIIDPPNVNRKLSLKSSRTEKSIGPIHDQFGGLKSVHFVGKVDSRPGKFFIIFGRRENYIA